MKKIFSLFRDGSQISQCFFWILLFICVALLITSFFIPPVGVINQQTILAVAEVMGFASVGAALAAIQDGINIKATKGDLTIEASQLKKDDED